MLYIKSCCNTKQIKFLLPINMTISNNIEHLTVTQHTNSEYGGVIPCKAFISLLSAVLSPTESNKTCSWILTDLGLLLVCRLATWALSFTKNREPSMFTLCPVFRNIQELSKDNKSQRVNKKTDIFTHFTWMGSGPGTHKVQVIPLWEV